MNALDQPISEVSVKIDNEDMNILNLAYHWYLVISYEANVCRKYKDEFHQKLLAI